MISRPVIAAALALTIGCSRQPSPAAAPALETIAEQSKFTRTGRFDEVERLCAAYAQTWPDAVKCVEFGRTPEGRPMLALVASRRGVLTAAAAREQNVPVMMMQGGIHAGEIDGKDAGFLALRELLRDEQAPGALKSSVIVFVPVYNIDGHERFGKWNRPNQTGPEEMGWRTTAQNYNLNRDYTKADAPETQAMLRLLNEWDPLLYVDLHVTDGAQFQHDVSITGEPVQAGDPQLQPAGRALIADLNKSLTASGSLPVDFYPDFVRPDDPTSGFARSANTPRFSTGYWPLHNRFALLVETHSWKDYATRVRTTHSAIVALAGIIASRGKEMLEQAHAADARAQQLGGQQVPLDYQMAPHTTMIDFRGYAYTRTPSAISGGVVIKYDPNTPQVWEVPLLDTVMPRTVATAPTGGYIVPAAHAGWMADKLTLHGVRFTKLASASNAMSVEAFRAESVTRPPASVEGHMLATIKGAWQTEQRAVPAGSLFVPTAQPAARLVMTLLEPTSADSYAAWGFFNNAFEQKEYMEAYVTEQVAAEMLKDPAVAAEFEKRLASDPAFAASPQPRLEFFYKRHASYDDRLNLYPVYRTSAMF
jgi:hypothetical protein